MTDFIVCAVHKCQGQTMQRAAVYLPSPVFTHGLLYVALSRIGNAADVRIMVRDMHHMQGRSPSTPGTYTRNVVWREVFEAFRLDLEPSRPADRHERDRHERSADETHVLLQRMRSLTDRRNGIVRGTTHQEGNTDIVQARVARRAAESESREASFAQQSTVNENARRLRQQRRDEAVAQSRAAMSAHRARERAQRQEAHQRSAQEAAERRETAAAEAAERRAAEREARRQADITRDNGPPALEDTGPLHGEGGSEDDRICMICLENVPPEQEAQITPPCHPYHTDCITRWLRESSCCPVCRRAITAINGRGVRRARARADTTRDFEVAQELRREIELEETEQSHTARANRARRHRLGTSGHDSEDEVFAAIDEAASALGVVFDVEDPPFSRFSNTMSWLYVPLIRAALRMDPVGHIYPAAAYMPALWWDAIVGVFMSGDPLTPLIAAPISRPPSHPYRIPV